MSNAGFCVKCGHELCKKVVKEHERDVERIACSKCDFIKYDNPTPVCMCVVEQGGKVLLARNKDWPSGVFGLIAGFLERSDSSPESGMARELEEELGVVVDPSQLSLLGVASLQRLNQICIVYHVVLPETDVVKPNPAELEAVSWVPLAKLKLGWKEGPGPLLQKWLMQRMGINQKSKL